eukprot:481538_1
MMSISITWSFHRFVFNVSHFSMCIALLVMCIDSFVDVICVLLLFKYSDAAYNACCKCTYTNIQCRKCGCDYYCTLCCFILAKRHLGSDYVPANMYGNIITNTGSSGVDIDVSNNQYNRQHSTSLKRQFHCEIRPRTCDSDLLLSGMSSAPVQKKKKKKK